MINIERRSKERAVLSAHKPCHKPCHRPCLKVEILNPYPASFGPFLVQVSYKFLDMYTVKGGRKVPVAEAQNKTENIVFPRLGAFK